MEARQVNDYSAEQAPYTGDFVDNKTMSAQRMGGSTTSVGVTLPQVGAAILGIEQDDDVPLIIYEKGIWIPKDD